MVVYDKERKDWVIKKTGAQRASKRLIRGADPGT